MPSSYTLGQRFESLIKDLIAAGRYNNASEVIRDGLRMLEERERRLSTLDAAIARGLADADAGRVNDIQDVRTKMAEPEPHGRRRQA